MSKSKLEYIWLDGYVPTANLRSKTKVIDGFSGKLSDVPLWGFDGSSTQQAVTGSSDCLLKPVAIFPDVHVVDLFHFDDVVGQVSGRAALRGAR